MAIAITQFTLDITWNTDMIKVFPQSYDDDVLTSTTDAFPTLSVSLEQGTGEGKANAMWKDTYYLYGNATVTGNLANLTTNWGDPFAFSLVKVFMIRLRSPQSGQSVRLLPAASDDWTALQPTGNGTSILGEYWATDETDGYPVTANNSNFKIANGNVSIPSTVDVVAVGEATYS